MSEPLKTKLLKLTLLLTGISLVAMIVSRDETARAGPQNLPEGKGATIVRDKCLTCHEADLIIMQRLSRQGWTREIEKMIRWGATVAETEKEILVDYLAAHFSPKPALTKTDEARGKEIFEKSCLVCHAADLTEQQRLSRQGWTREVDKMIRWGAIVADQEKEQLIDFLSKNYAPR
jgi:cytochrome c5